MTVACDRCRECMERGDRFCVYCGEMLKPLPRSGCDRCSECFDNGDTFCRYCGKYLTDDEHPLLKIGFAMGLITAVILSIVLTLEYSAAIWGIPQVLPRLPDYGSTLIIVVPVVVDMISFNGILSQIYYILLILAVTASIGVLFYKAIGPAKSLMKGNNRKIRDTAFFEMPVLFSVLFIWEMAYFLILQGLGVDTNGLPDRDTWIWMYELLEASVWEEVITRMLFIGLPTALIAFQVKKEGKGSWKYLFGGFGFSRTAIFLILFSALFFGLGHVGGWGWWKFFSTFVFGLITGYLFCKYGVYATIAMHFLTDYMSAEGWVLGNDSAFFTAMTFALLSFICMPYTFIYLKRGALALRDLFFPQNNDLK